MQNSVPSSRGRRGAIRVNGGLSTFTTENDNWWWLNFNTVYAKIWLETVLVVHQEEEKVLPKLEVPEEARQPLEIPEEARQPLEVAEDVIERTQTKLFLLINNFVNNFQFI